MSDAPPASPAPLRRPRPPPARTPQQGYAHSTPPLRTVAVRVVLLDVRAPAVPRRSIAQATTSGGGRRQTRSKLSLTCWARTTSLIASPRSTRPQFTSRCPDPSERPGLASARLRSAVPGNSDQRAKECQRWASEGGQRCSTHTAVNANGPCGSSQQQGRTSVSTVTIPLSSESLRSDTCPPASADYAQWAEKINGCRFGAQRRCKRRQQVQKGHSSSPTEEVPWRCRSSLLAARPRPTRS